MADIKILTEYNRIGNAFISTHGLQSAHIENFKVEDATIIGAFYGQTERCLDGTPAPRGLNITIKYDSFGIAGRTFTDSNDIIDFMKAYNVKKPEELVGRKIRTYNRGARLEGLEPILD